MRNERTTVGSGTATANLGTCGQHRVTAMPLRLAETPGRMHRAGGTSQDVPWSVDPDVQGTKMRRKSGSAGRDFKPVARPTLPPLRRRLLNRPGMSGELGVSRVLRRLDFWILVPDTRRPSWEDGVTRRSFVAKSSTRSRRVAASCRSHTTSTSASSRSTPGARQDSIDKAIVPGLTSKEKSELSSAKKRIAEVETELKAARRGVELLPEEASQKGGSRRSK